MSTIDVHQLEQFLSNLIDKFRRVTFYTMKNGCPYQANFKNTTIFYKDFVIHYIN